VVVDLRHAAIDRDGGGEHELGTVAGETAGLEKVARGVEVHLGAEREVLLRPARDERSEMEYHADVGCDERPGERRIGEVADYGGGRGLIRSQDRFAAQSTNQRGTDVACGPGDEYSHGQSILNRRRAWFAQSSE
jgi:hypothetical protein